MRKKARKYIHYAVKFAKSPNKKVIIRDLSNEIKTKGFLHGIRSMLHQKVHGKTYEHTGLPRFRIQSFDRRSQVALPVVTDPKVSVIIPMYNQLDYTLNCVNAIYLNRSFQDYEIIIADDNSKEDSSVLSACFQNIVVIRNPANLGFLKNCNNAAQAAKGEYLVFLNNDTQVQEHWLEELLAIFHNYDGVGLVGSKLVYPDGRLQEAGGILWKDGSAWNYGNRDNPNKPEYNYVKEADYISGASIMIPRKLWNELGGFDELYLPAYYEDTDLCFRVRDKGYKVMYQPFSVVVHFEGVTHGTDVKAGIKQHQVLNQKKFYDRWQGELSRKADNGVNLFKERDRSTGRRHVLVVDHYLPQVDKDAGSRCISNFIDCLLALGHSVSFLGENQVVSKKYEQSFQEKGVEVLYGSDYNFSDQRWKEYLKKHLSDFDVILLSRSSVCVPIMTFLRKELYKGNVIYFGHDLGYLRLEKEADADNDESLRSQARRIRAAEDFMYQNADNSLVLSQDELAYLSRYITRPLHYVPAYFFEAADKVNAFENREGLLFVGGFNHPPNRDAMLWFLDEVYDSLYHQNVSLTIVGSKMPASLQQYKDKYKTLRILSDISVNELNSLYASCRIAIVPLRYGAGVKGKVIEAMAKGVPVVGTGIAFEGMPKDDRFIYKGVDTPNQLAARILAVHSNKDTWNELSQFGVAYVREYFNRERMKEVFEKLTA